jgi:multiple sugar transport system permease protein
MNRVAASPVRTKVTWPLRLANWAGWALLYAVLILGAVIMAFPFYWMITTAFKGLSESVAIPPTLWPTKWIWTNFIDAWQAAPFPRYFLNTVIMAVGSTVGTLITGALAAYAFARMRFFGKDVLFMMFLMTMMIPFEVTLIPDFLIIRTLHWYNTYTALIVPWTASVFSIFLLRQFFMSLPKELYEATILDGGTHFQFLYRVAIPLAIPALITVAIFSFLGSWNSLLWPLIVTSSPNLRPIQVGLSAFQGEAGSYYNLLMAGATLAILPIVILFLVAQKQFVEGIARSGIKG